MASTANTDMLSAFRVRKYRCFAEWNEIKLRPLTLVFGYNNVGKSALIRFLPGLAESVRADVGPLHLGGSAFRDASFSDVAWRGMPETEFELSWSGGEECRWLLRHDPSKGPGAHWVDELEFSNADGHVELQWNDRPLATGLHLPDQNNYLANGELSGGYTVRSLPLGGDEPLARVQASLLAELPRQVAWVEGYRGMPARSQRVPSSQSRDLVVDGAKASGMLAQLGPSPLNDHVAAFYTELGYKLTVEFKPEGRFSVNLTSKHGWPVNLVDSGEGMAQVLPVLVALERARLGLGPRIVCVEQPELHLHPAGQLALAKRFVEAAMQNDPGVTLVETHANHLMLAVQLALAKGELTPDRVQVYWVRQQEDGQSIAEPVKLDNFGRDTSDTWPPGVFTEDARLARQILRARRARP
jgi:hypothetical protein